MIDNKYKELLQDILENGVEKDTRNGKTISVFGRQIRHKMNQGFPLLTTKKMYWKGIVTELLWFLRGNTNIQWLVQNNCNIWNGDAYQAYLNKLPPETDIFDVLTTSNFIDKIKTDDEFAKKWGDLGPIYGSGWRNWKSYKHAMNFSPYLPVNKDGKTECYVEIVDQIQNSINLLKTEPDSRRNIVSAWNVGELDKMTLPPCHNFFQFYTRELSHDERQKWVINNVDWIRNSEDPEHAANKYLYRGEPKIYGDSVPKRTISLMWNQRSVDTFLGLPFNMASYGLLLEMIAKEVNMIPDELIGTLGDVHLYKNHIEQAKEQLTREPMDLPIVKLSSGHNLRAALKGNSEEIHIDDMILIGYESHPPIKAPLNN